MHPCQLCKGGDHRFTAKWRAVLRIRPASFSRFFDCHKESSWIEALRRVHQEVWDIWKTYKHKEGLLPDCFPLFLGEVTMVVDGHVTSESVSDSFH